MNIFVLDLELHKCAQYHCDAHVSKMILESAQLLASAIHSLPLTPEDKESFLPRNKQGKPYGAGYKNHPCAKWAGESLQNFLWLRSFVFALQDEFFYRYGKEHASYLTVKERVPTWIDPSIFPKQHATLWPNATTIKDRVCETPSDVVQLYRDYYNKDKTHLFTWTRREIPHWVVGGTHKMGDRWNAQAEGKTELGAKDQRRTKAKRRLKADVINELNDLLGENNLEDFIPKANNLTIAQLDGIAKLIKL